MGLAVIEHRFAPHSGRVEECLASLFPLSAEQTSELIDLGAIYINRKRSIANQAVQEGDYLRIHLEPRRFSVSTIDWRARVVGETAELVILDKPPSIPLHPTVDNQVENVLVQLQRALEIPLFVTHRLDRPTTGLCAFAKSPEAQTRFNKQLLQRRVQKIYRAWTAAPVRVGLKTHYMEPNPRSPKQISGDAVEGWKKCELVVRTCSARGHFWESEIELLTGRTHQIRSQLAADGAQILGDTLYGGREVASFHSEHIALHAMELSFSTAASTEMFRSLPNWQN